jgi:hypothetical protein
MAAFATEETLQLLQKGKLELEGLISWGSNYTFLGQVCRGQEELAVIYKPRKGERPLWDFPSGTLCLRERAAFLVSDLLGWRLVPPTILRDGPHGWGSVQKFVEHDPDSHYFTFQGQYPEQLQRIVLFDLLINNADRKGGHVLVDDDEHLWSIDHGICFHVEYKLRTVIWEFAGEKIPPEQLAALAQLQEKLVGEEDASVRNLRELLSEREMEALQRRLESLLAQPVFPHPGPGRHYPWPPV